MRYKAQGIPRRLFLGTGIGALASRLSQPAEADTRFTDFRFPATGAPVGRTIPERLSDVVNILDWVAVSRGKDDTAAIQAAIDYCINKGGGKVFFPPGVYRVTSVAVGTNDPSKANNAVQIIGSGHATGIFSTSHGFILSKGSRAYDLLESVENMQVGANGMFSDSGAVQFTRPAAIACNVIANGFYGIDATASQGASVYSCYGAGPGYGSNAGSNNATSHGFCVPGSIGIALGNGGVASGCGARGHGIGYALSGNGVAVIGSYTEVSNIAVRVGWSAAGETAASGVLVSAFQSEQIDVGIDLYNCTGGYISGCIWGTGGAGLPDPAPITNITWSGGTATVTSAGHNITTSPAYVGGKATLQFSPFFPSAFASQYGGPGIFQATIIDANTFSYPLTSNPGSWGTNTGGWRFPLSYGIRCRKVYETVVTAQTDCPRGKASVDLDYEGDSDVQFANNVFEATLGGNGWIIPVGRKLLAGWKFVNCCGTASPYSVIPNNVASPTNQMVFADLPGQSGVYQSGPLEGQQYDITDGSGTFGGTVTGGGSGKYLVRYDGTNWIRIG